MVRIGSGFKAGHYTGGKGPGLKGITSRAKNSVSIMRGAKATGGLKKPAAIKRGKASYANPLRG